MGNNCSDTSPAGPGPGSGTSTTETKSYDPIILERKDLDEKLANKMTWSQSGSVMTIVAVGKLKLLSNKAKARVNSQKEEQDKKTENNRNLTIKQSKFHNEVPVYNNGHHAYHNRQNTTSTELLKQRLDFLGLESVESVGDGNCQFRSISNELYATQNHHLHIRKIAVFWLKEHSEEYYCYVGDNNEWKKYLYNMSQPRTWGDELTLRAVCDALSE